MRTSLVRSLSTALVLLTALLLGACTTVRGSGRVITEERTVSGFNAVELDGSGTLLITQGDAEALTISGDDTCPACQTTCYSYHSCRNRHCPTCQQDASVTWLAEQQALLLPVPYFLVTFTLPAELRAVARQHPETLYPLLFHASSTALQQLARDPRFLGGQIGMLGVLQTWTRDLRYHSRNEQRPMCAAARPAGKRCSWFRRFSRSDIVSKRQSQSPRRRAVVLHSSMGLS